MQQTKAVPIKWLSTKEFVPEDMYKTVFLSNGRDLGAGTIEVTSDGKIHTQVRGDAMKLGEETWWTMINAPGMEYCDPLDVSVSLEEAIQAAIGEEEDDDDDEYDEYDEDDDEYEDDDEA